MSWRWMGGDPDGVSWAVTLVYLVAATFSFLAARHCSPRDGSSSTPHARPFWWCWGAALLFFGLNKELDLHDVARQWLRNLSEEQGWYHLRSKLKILFLITLVLAGLAFGVWAWRQFGSLFRRYRLASIGFLLLIVFVLGRASSVAPSHPAWTDWFHDRHGWGGLELFGAFLIGLEAFFVWRRIPRERD